jgi:hypothetical protein
MKIDEEAGTSNWLQVINQLILVVGNEGNQNSS